MQRSLDSKIDDGIPSNGKVYGIDYFGLGCVKQADGVTNARPDLYPSTDTHYNLTQTEKGCEKLYFYLD